MQTSRFLIVFIVDQVTESINAWQNIKNEMIVREMAIFKDVAEVNKKRCQKADLKIPQAVVNQVNQRLRVPAAKVKIADTFKTLRESEALLDYGLDVSVDHLSCMKQMAIKLKVLKAPVKENIFAANQW